MGEPRDYNFLLYPDPQCICDSLERHIHIKCSHTLFVQGKQRKSQEKRAFPLSLFSPGLQIISLAATGTFNHNASVSFAAAAEGSHILWCQRKSLYQSTGVGFPQSDLLSGNDMITLSSEGTGLTLPSSLWRGHTV